MRINGSMYVRDHQQQRDRECADGFVDGCAKVGTFRGNLGALASAIANAGVSVDFLLSVTTVRKIAETEAGQLAARGVQLIFHDDNDIELAPPARRA